MSRTFIISLDGHTLYDIPADDTEAFLRIIGGRIATSEEAQAFRARMAA